MTGVLGAEVGRLGHRAKGGGCLLERMAAARMQGCSSTHEPQPACVPSNVSFPANSTTPSSRPLKSPKATYIWPHHPVPPPQPSQLYNVLITVLMKTANIVFGCCPVCCRTSLSSLYQIVYVAPMKALAAEVTANFGKRLAPLGLVVRELTGGRAGGGGG